MSWLAFCGAMFFMIFCSIVVEQVGESTPWGGGQNCYHIVLFFRGPVFEIQPCHFYENISQYLCILW